MNSLVHDALVLWFAQVPRMLWEQGDMAGLERQVMQSAEPGLLTWWARYCESTGRFQDALSCYQRAGGQAW